MPVPRRSSAALTLLLASCALTPPAVHSSHATLLSAAEANDAQLRRHAERGCDTVALLADAPDAAAAAARVRAHGMRLAWWVEVARCPALADARPELMASLQGHDDWRRCHPRVPAPNDGEVTKVWPWVPVLSEEGFAAQRARVLELLRALPAGDTVFLCDLQGAPSACGCGSLLCRWIADYGPIKTNTPAAADAAARFCQSIASALPDTKVVPVWVTECEPDDPECGHVPCFTGKCWRAFDAQWRPLVAACDTVAVLLSARSLQREPLWPARALALLRQQTAAAPARALMVVVDAADAETGAHGAPADLGAFHSVVFAAAPIDQSWEPRVVRYAR